ncbi:hypothetical protein IQ07DRAFT_606533 [Pyrenochaeta sp. DS3sAY3a]|nr:hypothetical protein IQ07DRAFT_606533 [Pyrenochaeta sp. DS3sAY3a]
MDFETLREKHLLSQLQHSSLPERKRKRMSCDKPDLRVDCSVPPRPLPQPMSFLSPLQFPLDPSLASDNPFQYSSGFYRQQSHTQHAITPHRLTGSAENVQPMWTSSNLPYGVTSNFSEMCQTSVASSYSVYSSVSNTQNPFKAHPEVVSIGAHNSPPRRVEDARDMFIRALVSRLSSLKETLANEQKGIEELLEVAALLIEYGCVAENKT